MLGELTFSDGTKAALLDDGTWRCDDEILNEILNAKFNPRDMRGSSVVFPFGYIAVRLAGAELGAKANTTMTIHPLDEGEVA